ncbi:hypothetical protein, partial [Actinoplanes siamensis]
MLGGAPALADTSSRVAGTSIIPCTDPAHIGLGQHVLGHASGLYMSSPVGTDLLGRPSSFDLDRDGHQFQQSLGPDSSRQWFQHGFAQDDSSQLVGQGLAQTAHNLAHGGLSQTGQSLALGGGLAQTAHDIAHGNLGQ